MPADFQTEKYRWFNYQSKRCYDHSPKQSWLPQIEDSYGFNQSINRSLNRVDEVCVEFELDLDSDWVQAGKAELLAAIVAGQQTHLARFVFDQDSVDVQLFNSEKQIATAKHCRIDRELPTCAISNVDSQITVVVGDRPVLVFDSGESGSRAKPDSPVEILVSLQPANSVGLSGLSLWRDIYYYSPLSRDELLRRQAGEGLAGTEGYFVVGDNLPVSWDSRRWLLPRVAADDILGVVDIGQ